MPSSVIVTSKHFLSAPECRSTVRAWTVHLGTLTQWPGSGRGARAPQDTHHGCSLGIYGFSWAWRQVWTSLGHRCQEVAQGARGRARGAGWSPQWGRGPRRLQQAETQEVALPWQEGPLGLPLQPAPHLAPGCVW